MYIDFMRVFCNMVHIITKLCGHVLLFLESVGEYALVCLQV